MLAMFRRVFTAPMLALCMLVSAGVVADVQAASLPAASTTATVTQAAAPQVVAPQLAAPQTSGASFTCGTGLIATICAVVLGPICRDRCLAATPASPSTAALTGAASRTRQAAGATQATAPSTDIVCAPGFQILCAILGLTVCRNHPCGAAPAPAISTPSITCDTSLLCYVLGLTVCRHGCAFAPADNGPAMVINPGELCTVNMRPNPFCWLP
jgi:hypothetical protein